MSSMSSCHHGRHIPKRSSFVRSAALAAGLAPCTSALTHTYILLLLARTGPGARLLQGSARCGLLTRCTVDCDHRFRVKGRACRRAQRLRPWCSSFAGTLLSKVHSRFLQHTPVLLLCRQMKLSNVTITALRSLGPRRGARGALAPFSSVAARTAAPAALADDLQATVGLSAKRSPFPSLLVTREGVEACGSFARTQAECVPRPPSPPSSRRATRATLARAAALSRRLI